MKFTEKHRKCVSSSLTVRGFTKLALLAVLGVGGVAGALFLRPTQAAAESLKVSKDTAEAVTKVKEPTSNRVAEFKSHLEQAQQLASELAKSEDNPKTLDEVVTQLESHAQYFEGLAEDETQIEAMFTGGIAKVKEGDTTIDGNVATLNSRVQELQEKVNQASIPEEKRGYALAAKLCGQRIGLWKALGKANSSVEDGLGTAKAQMHRLVRVAAANAEVFREASETARLSRDMQKGSEILKTMADADVDELVSQMEETWSSLDRMTAQMSADATQIAALSTHDKTK